MRDEGFACECVHEARLGYGDKWLTIDIQLKVK